MKSDKRTRNRTLTVLFCLISILTALDPGRSKEIPTPISSSPQNTTSAAHHHDFGRMSWMQTGLLTGTSDDAFSARLRPDLERATATELLIAPDSELLRRTSDTVPSDFDFTAPSSAPMLMAHVNGMPTAPGVGGAPIIGGPVLGPPSGSACTPEQSSNPNSACFKGETPVQPRAVPEPSAIVLVATGIIVIAAGSRLRHQLF